ncbi:MAG: PPOX class F420-dependent oxidoreductase [Chloroflexaceae bacterium]|nr:PPOX class F420-dependent oxidoreductase [Chloroflexaceae bacterium]
MTQTHQNTGFSVLHRHQYANLFTFRKSGEAVKTPVWFALRDGKAYVMTTMDSGKVKRIRNNGRVLIGPSDRGGRPLGPTVEARARVLAPEEIAVAKDALDEKYGLMKAVFDFFMTVGNVQRAWIEIEPA